MSNEKDSNCRKEAFSFEKENKDLTELAASENYERAKRIVIHTGDGKVTFCTPISFERVAVYETSSGLALDTTEDEHLTKLLLEGKKFVMIEHPKEGQAYPVPEIAGAYADNTYELVNDIYAPNRFTERTDRQIETTVLADRVIIDLYNMTAETLTFVDLGRLTAIADCEVPFPGAVTAKLEGGHTEVECDALAGLLMAHSELYGYHSAEGELEHIYSTVFFESGERGFFEAFQI